MRRADVIWTVLEWEWMGASFLQRLGLMRAKPIIGNNVFLAQEYSTMPRLRRWAYRLLMTDNVHLTVHAERAVGALQPLFPGRRFHLMHFGVPTEKFPVTPPRITREPGPLRIYSIGGDKGRDWQSILDAFGGDPRFQVRLVAKRLEPSAAAGHANVVLTHSLTEAEERANYGWADYVIVAMHENIYSGITVMLEAAASGVPMIVSRTGGAETYFGDDEVFYVEPGRPEALRSVALSQSAQARAEKAQAAQRRFIDAGYSADAMVGRYVEISRSLLGAPAGR
jgi:glycosyltransferase involved in cell wall biosynthesis